MLRSAVRSIPLLALVTACAPTPAPTTDAPAAAAAPDADAPPAAIPTPPVEVEPRASEGAAVATLPVAAPPADAIRTSSGLAYVYVRRGTGTTKPRPGVRVRAHYTGWHTDGSKFDSSYDRDEPIEFDIEQVIPGWTEALQLMVAGDVIRVWIPQELAYKGKPGRPAGTLVFDIELLAAG